MPDIPDNAIKLARQTYVMPEALSLKAKRSSGPGGQNVNKVSTAIELRVRVTDIVNLPDDAADRLRKAAGSKLTKEDEILLTAEETRSQESNRQRAIERLRQMVALALHRPKKRKKTRPSRRAKQRRLDAKKQRGQTKALRRKPTD